MDLAKLIRKKSLLILELDAAKSYLAYPPKQVHQLARDIAELEGLAVKHLLSEGKDQDAVVNMISQASCLIVAGHNKRAIKILQKALDLTQRPTLKKWIKNFIKESENKGPWQPETPKIKSRKNPLKVEGVVCDFCGKPNCSTVYFCHTFMLGNTPRSQFMGCDDCAKIINNKDIRTLSVKAARLLPLKFRKKAKAHFAQLYTEFFINLIESRPLEAKDLFDLYIARATAKHQKCELKTGHPKLGSCVEIAALEVETPGGWRKGCLVCIAAGLQLDDINQTILHPKIRIFDT